jgi:hypothetical protein
MFCFHIVVLLSSKKNFFFQSQILEVYKDIVHNQINPKLPEYFENIPDVPLE